MPNRWTSTLMMMLVGGVAWAQRVPVAGRAGEGEEGIIEPEADAALRRMSDHLGGLRSFRVDITTVDENVTTEGQKIQELKETKVTVRRPGRLLAERVGPAGPVALRYDGRQISIYVPAMHLYAVENAPPTLTAMIDDARDRLHVEAPAADLLLPDSYHELIEGVTVGRYLGRERMPGGAWAHHLAMTKKDVDWQIWIQDGPNPVPLRYVITTKDVPGNPQFTAELRNWRPNAPVSDKTFAFTPPSDVQCIAFADIQKLKPPQHR